MEWGGGGGGGNDNLSIFHKTTLHTRSIKDLFQRFTELLLSSTTTVPPMQPLSSEQVQRKYFIVTQTNYTSHGGRLEIRSMVSSTRMEISNCCISYLEYKCTALNIQSVPETKYTYKGGRLEIRSMVFLPRMEISNCCISYLEYIYVLC